MTGDKIFIDTAPLIYLVENHPKYIEPISLYLANVISNNGIFVTSVVTIAEFGIKPKKLKRLDVLTKFNNIVDTLLSVKEINWDVAEISSTLRVRYPALRSADSFQLACALENKCTTFLTNDRKLKSIKEIEVLLVKDL